MADTSGGRGNPGTSGRVRAGTDRLTVESPASIGPAAAPAAADAGDYGEHPGIVIRQGPTGPRAALFDGPDVWEVIVAMHAVHDEDPARQGQHLRSELCLVTGLTAVQVSAALDYYAATPRASKSGSPPTTKLPSERSGHLPPAGYRPADVLPSPPVTVQGRTSTDGGTPRAPRIL